jgi:hypothetical protein
LSFSKSYSGNSFKLEVLKMRLSKLSLATLLIVTSLTFVGKAQATCTGSECNDRDPAKEECATQEEVDAKRTRPVDTQEFSIYSYGPWWNKQRRRTTVVLMYSEKCKANWAKADVPVGTKLYVEEYHEPAYKRGDYTTTTDGWSYGGMSTGEVTNRACALLPGDPNPKCTLFK